MGGASLGSEQSSTNKAKNTGWAAFQQFCCILNGKILGNTTPFDGVQVVACFAKNQFGFLLPSVSKVFPYGRTNLDEFNY